MNLASMLWCCDPAKNEVKVFKRRITPGYRAWLSTCCPSHKDREQQTTIIDDKGSPWWVAKEICAILDLNTRDSVRYSDDDEKMNVSTKHVQDRGHGGDNGKRVAISESGLYELIFKSRKPEARQFKRWITHIVIPEIRQTGGFIHATADMSDDEVLARGLEVSQRKLEVLRGQVQELLPKAEAYDYYLDTDTLIDQKRAARLKTCEDCGSDPTL